MMRALLAVFGSAALWLAAVLYPQEVPNPEAVVAMWQGVTLLSVTWLAWEAAEWARGRLKEVEANVGKDADHA